MRRLLLVALGVVVVAALAFGAAAVALYSRADTSTVGELEFDNELRIPPLLEARSEGGREVFDLTLQRGGDTWGVNGPYLGPTLRASRGDDVTLRVRNELGVATTLHWHGMHLPARADGGPHQSIAPNAVWTPAWTVDQPAATLWYHAHPHGETADQVYRGLAGMFVLDDEESPELPDEYGVDDVPLILQDRRLDDDGELELSQSVVSTTGRLGGTILVNGTYDPHLDVRHERVRFRLLNVSNARIYAVGFADARAFDLIATDGGLLERPRRVTRVQLSPGERAEVVARFRPGEAVVLRSFEPELGTNFFEERFAGGDDSFDLLEIRAAASLEETTRVPARLVTHERLAETARRTRTFELSNTAINGEEFDHHRIDEVVTSGSVEVWVVRNTSGTPHNFHPHGVSFRVLDYAGGAPPPEAGGWKDTVYVPPGTTVRLLVPFGPYADRAAAYVLHCHLLQHEDGGMMGQFVVVRPGRG